MTWRYELRKDDVLKIANSYLHNPEGTASVRGWWSKHWGFEYTRKDLNVCFSVSPDYIRCPDRLQPLLSRDRRLGPACTVFFDKKNRERLLAEEDYPLIVADIKDALRSHWQFNMAEPPPIEQVAFRNKELERFSD